MQRTQLSIGSTRLRFARLAILPCLSLSLACGSDQPVRGDDSSNEQVDSTSNDAVDTTSQETTSSEESTDTTTSTTTTSTTTTTTTTTTTSTTTSSEETSTSESDETNSNGGCKDADDCADDPDHPHCNGLLDTCVACITDDHCVDPAAPICQTNPGECIQCNADADCAMQPDGGSCIENVCTRCDQLIGQCGDAACNLATGECLSQLEVFWVSSDAGCNDTVGTKEQPFCRLEVALTKLDSLTMPRATLHLSGSYKRGLKFDKEGIIALIGDGKTSFVGVNGGQSEAFVVSGKANILASGLDLKSDAGSAVSCTDAQLSFFDSIIHDSWATGITAKNCPLLISNTTIQKQQTKGIDASGGDVVLDRAIIANNFQDGVSVSSGNLTARNTFFGRNGVGGGAVSSIRLSASKADITFTTFSHVQGLPQAQISCGSNSELTVRNSILVGGGDMTLSMCNSDKISNSVVDLTALKDKEGNLVPDMVPAPSAWYIKPDATPPDLHLKAASDAEVTKLKGIAKVAKDDPATDIDGEARAKEGESDWPGADIPK